MPESKTATRQSAVSQTAASQADARQSASRKSVGRPVKFDQSVQQQFLGLLRVGCTRGKAARLVGVGRSTVRIAAKRDPAIAAAINAAVLHCQTRALRRISRAGKTNWRAAAWLIEWQADRHARRQNKTITPRVPSWADPTGWELPELPEDDDQQ